MEETDGVEQSQGGTEMYYKFSSFELAFGLDSPDTSTDATCCMFVSTVFYSFSWIFLLSAVPSVLSHCAFRYNVKRRCAELPPISKELFESKLAELQKPEPETKETKKCKICSKNFKSLQQFEQHLQSNKHKQAVSAVNSLAAAVVNGEPGLKLPSSPSHSPHVLSLASSPLPPGLVPSISSSFGHAASSASTISTGSDSAAAVASASATFARNYHVEEEPAETNEDEDEEDEEKKEEDQAQHQLDIIPGIEISSSSSSSTSATVNSSSSSSTADRSPVLPCDCLFCPHHSEAWESSLQHMTADHYFFIPCMDDEKKC